MDRRITGNNTVLSTRAPDYPGPFIRDIDRCCGIFAVDDNLDVKSGVYVAADSCMIAAGTARSVMQRNAVSWSR